MSVINREDVLRICDNAINLWKGQLGEGALIAVRKSILSLPDADDGWITYTGQHIENGRYLVQTKTGIIVCGTYCEYGFVFPFRTDEIEAFRPLPKPYEPQEG